MTDQERLHKFFLSLVDAYWVDKFSLTEHDPALLKGARAEAIRAVADAVAILPSPRGPLSTPESRAVLIYGPTGTGKTTAARLGLVRGFTSRSKVVPPADPPLPEDAEWMVPGFAKLEYAGHSLGLEDYIDRKVREPPLLPRLRVEKCIDLANRLRAASTGRAPAFRYESGEEVERTEEFILERLCPRGVSVFEDLGREQIPTKGFRERTYYTIFEQAGCPGRVTLVTSNLSPAELEEYMGGPAWDRLRALCGDAIVHIGGESLR